MKHEFSNEYITKKNNLLTALQSETCGVIESRKSALVAVRLILIAAIISVFTIGVFAVSSIVDFTASKDGYKAEVKASVVKQNTDETSAANTRLPLAWNAGEGETSVKLNFAYLPEDMYCDMATPYKYRNTSFTRSISFEGYDLQRDDFDTLLGGITDIEEFRAGENKAYILYGGEANYCDKIMYVLFENEMLVVRMLASYEVTVDELKLIAENLTVSYTDDAEEALPITNEPRGSGIDIQKVYHSEPNPIYYSELYNIGDTVEHKGYFDENTTKITVESYRVIDGIAGLNDGCFLNKDFVNKFIDDGGNFVPYVRTEYIYGDGENTLNSFGESSEITKKMVLLTVKLEGKEFEDAKPFLHSFDLCGMEVNSDGEINCISAYDGYVYNRTPGTRIGTHDAVYREYVGDNVWVLGYVLDEWELEENLWWYTTKNAIGENIGYIIK